MILLQIVENIHFQRIYMQLRSCLASAPPRYSGMYLDVKFLFLVGASLGLLLVMNVEPNLLTGIYPQPLFQHLPDPCDTVGLRCVRQPNRQLVTLGSHIHNRSVNLKIKKIIFVKHGFNFTRKNIRIRLNKKQDSIQWEWPLSSFRPKTISHITLLWVIWGKACFAPEELYALTLSAQAPGNFLRIWKTPWWDFTGSISTVVKFQSSH